MASMKCKRMVAVATLATSVMVMGGTAFADNLVPDPAGKAVETARSNVADGLNQIDGLNGAFTTGNLAPDPAGKAVETARNAVGDGLNQIKKAFQ